LLVRKEMGMKLLLVLLVLGACQFFPAETTANTLGRLSRQWRDLWLGRDGGSPLLGLGLIVGLPLLGLGIVLYLFSGFWHGVFMVPVALLVLGWALLDRHAPDAVHRFREEWLTRSWPEGEPDLIPQETSLALELGNARKQLLQERLSELFTPLFWYLFLGPLGVLGVAAAYLIRLTAELAEVQPAGAVAREWLVWVDWIPARVLALSLALAGNFVDTWQYLKAHLRDTTLLSVDLLDQAAQAAHPGRLQTADTTPGATLVLALSEIEALLKRALIIWIVLLALHTLWP
jgi:AmpE protein